MPAEILAHEDVHALEAGLADDGRHDVVVPAVGVVVGEDDGHVLPLRQLLQAVEGLDQEALLAEGIGITGVAVLIRRRLEVADLRQVPGLRGQPEVAQVVLMIGLVVMPDHRHGGRRQVVRVGRGLVILEGLVVRDVVRPGPAVEAARVAVCAGGPAVGRAMGRVEAALEPAPSHALAAEQLSYVGPRHADGGRGGAVVELGVGVLDHGAGHRQPLSRIRQVGRLGALRPAGDEVERAGRRRAEDGVEVVVAHRVMLGVVPERRDRVAVEIVHHDLGVALRPGGAHRLDEAVHEPAVIGLLLLAVAVIHVAGGGLGAGQPLGSGGIGIGGEQRPFEPVDGRRAGQGVESGLAGRVQRVRIGAEVVIEGDVLLEDHDEVLHRRGRSGERGAGGKKKREDRHAETIQKGGSPNVYRM